MKLYVITPTSVSPIAHVPDTAPTHGFIWCDATYNDQHNWVEIAQRISGVTFFDDHLRDAENHSHPSYFESTHEYEMIIFRGLMPLPKTLRPEDRIELKTQPNTFFVMPGLLVLVRPPDSTLIPLICDRLLTMTHNRQRLPSSPEELMLRVVNALVDRYLNLRQPLTEHIERQQQQLLSPGRPFDDWMVLLQARSETRKLEQLCEEQLDALQEWHDERLERLDPASSEANRQSGLADLLQVRANDVVEHIHRVLNHARRLEAEIESAVQLHFSVTAHRTNDIMRTLTTLTAIFLPLTLITGVFGMNFEAIPGLQSPAGFWITMGCMALLALALMIHFHRRQYLVVKRNK